MDKTQNYIQTLKLEDVPWLRLTTAYGTAAELPKYFHTMWNMEHIGAVKEALNEVASNIEHQSTLWHSTPFSVIFLVRILEHALETMDKNKTAHFLAEHLLSFFQLIAECCEDAVELGMGEDELLPNFSDMLQEEYLYPEEYTEEKDDEYWDEYDTHEGLLNSFYYYSYQALLSCRKALEKLKGTDLEEAADELLRLLSSNPYEQ